MPKQVATVEKKQAELTAEMQRAVELLHMSVPPDPARIQSSKDAGGHGFAKSQYQRERRIFSKTGDRSL